MGHTANGVADSTSEMLDERVVPPLGMTGHQFLDAGTKTIEAIEKYYSAIEERPVLPSVAPGYLKDRLPDQAPEQGESWSKISEDIESKIMPGITHWQHPRYMAFFPASSTYPGILGEMWSAALTAPAFLWICSPVVTELETVVLDWLAKILRLPETFLSSGQGGGVIQGSASEAVVTVMVAARERYIRRMIEREGIVDPEELEDRSFELKTKLVAIGSDQAHSSIKKAAIIASTRHRSIETTAETAYALTGSAVRSTIEQLTAKGLRPFFCSVTIGTTNTCAVDDLEAIAEVAKDYPDIWFHCDAAYAGAALVLPEYHHLSSQLHFLDSFNMNMHKWLLTNFDASPLWVQKRKDLTDALDINPAYLRNQHTDSGLVHDYRNWQIPLGRRFRALKIWFVLRTWGVAGLQAHIRHHIKLGNLFADLVKSRSDLFKIVAPPAFALTVISIVCTRANNLNNSLSSESELMTPNLRPTKDELESANKKTEAVHRIMNEKDFFLTASELGGAQKVIRIVSANPLAEEKYIRKVFDALVETAEKVLRQDH